MRHRPSPSDEQNHRSDDLFRARLDQIIRSDHSLVRLADAMPWEGIVEQVADLLPPTPEGAGRASLPVRMMVGLLYLKYAYNLSDDQVLERWLESPYMQHFTGEVYFQHELPCDPSSLTRWRNRLDEAGAEELLAQTIEAAKTLKAIRPRELRVVPIDTTAQEKNVAHPAESRLLEAAWSKLAERAAEAGIKLRQSDACTGPRFSRQAGCYGHARQIKRMSEAKKRVRKRRQAVEPRIGHLKSGHRMRRNFLKGALGDAMTPILTATGFNIRWLMRWRVVFLALAIIRRPTAFGSDRVGSRSKLFACGCIAQFSGLIKQF